jgi:hypothetical protein
MSGFHKGVLKQGLLGVRKLHLGLDEHFASFRSKSKKPMLFNLDLHISVMRDLQQEFSSCNLQSVRWSISGSNKFARSIYKISDPVDVINAQTWSLLNEELICEFESRYQRFLSQFDGFVVTHTPAFSQLYRNFGKPILIINSTRYEAPYTKDENNWKILDNYLSNSVEKEKVLLVSNNVGDADYLKFRTGIESEVVPSFCDYTNLRWTHGGTQKVIISRSPELEDYIERVTSGEWLGIKKVMGKNYSWNQYLQIKEVLYIPYNISTMTLFELATAGVPVSVPSIGFTKELYKSFPGVLSELSYFQVNELPIIGLDNGDPNNYLSEKFQDWWLARADFYNSDLMPNVRVISEFNELMQDSSIYELQKDNYHSLIESRNVIIRKKRQDLVSRFSSML